MKELYGVTKNGENVYSFTLEGKNGFKAVLLNYGAIIDSIFAPDKDGNVVDVTLSAGNMAEYEADGNFLGVAIGPNANRIADGDVPIDGVNYQMLKNDGANNLHTDVENGIHKRVWDYEEGDNCVKFTIAVKDGEFGLPGNRVMDITYSVTEDNGLKIDYHATSDKKTIFNMTNHSHFNLAGHNSGSVLDHELVLHASNFTKIVAGAIPTGEIVSVLGTQLDFTEAKTVGRDIYKYEEQMKLVNGYDFNYVIDGHDGSVKEAAVLKDPKSGRIMRVFTDLPGIQLYTDNWVVEAPGKEGMVYNQRNGLCLETQDYPDSIHHDNFPDVVYGPDREYNTTTIYQFE